MRPSRTSFPVMAGPIGPALSPRWLAFAAAAAIGLAAPAVRAQAKEARLPPIPASFLVTDGGWVRFAHPPAARDRVARLAAHADEARGDLAEIVGVVVRDVEVRVGRSGDELGALAPEGTPLPRGTSASVPSRRLVLLALSSPGGAEPADLGEGFRREIARIALDDAARGRPVPAWIGVGLPLAFSGERTGARARTLLLATIRRDLVPIDALDGALAGGGRAPLAAAQAADLVRFLIAPPRRAAFAETVARIGRGEEAGAAIEAAFGATRSEIDRRYRVHAARRHAFLPVLTIGALAWTIAIAVAAARRIRAGRRAAAVARRPPSEAPERLLRAVATSRDDQRPVVDRDLIAARAGDADVPRVKHDGEWHTLH